MAKVKVDIPTDKMQSFIQAIVNLGLDTSAVLTKRYRKTMTHQKKLSDSLRKFFGWEYFSNELEFE